MRLSMVEATENRDVLQQLVNMYAKAKRVFIKLESKPDPWGGQTSIFTMRASENEEPVLTGLNKYLQEFNFDRGRLIAE